MPRIQDIAPVYAVISVIVYGWTFFLFFWKLPSWLHFLTPGEIFGAFSYGILTNTVESLIVILGLLLLSAILPARVLRDSFALRGSVITIVGLVSAMVYQYQFRAARLDFANPIKYWILVTVLVMILCIFLGEKSGGIKSFILKLSDRMIVFLYILIPLSVISIIEVVIRNLG